MKALAVTCPTCGADPFDDCTYLADGTRKIRPHRERRERARNETARASDVLDEPEVRR